MCSQEESRVGWLTGRRRRLTARGVRPGGLLQHPGEGVDGYGAAAPVTGERCFLALPPLHAERVQRCSDACAEACPERLKRLRRENRGAPTAERLICPAHVRVVCLPPYGPERTPLERVWRDLNEALAWRHCGHVDAPQDEVAERLRTDESTTLPALTGYPSRVEVLHALCA